MRFRLGLDPTGIYDPFPGSFSTPGTGPAPGPTDKLIPFALVLGAWLLLRKRKRK